MTKYVTVQITRKEPPAGPEGEVNRCRACSQAVTPEELAAEHQVCTHCGYHYPLTAPERVELLADPGSWRPMGEHLVTGDPLEFFDLRPYRERVSEARVETGLSEALLAGSCTLDGRPLALGVMDFRFLGGSMGTAVGDRFTLLVREAAACGMPLVVVTASGGARMQEGLLSLMQMAKTVVALQLLAERRMPFCSVLTHPTTGGVLASFATVADVIFAEPGALLSFTGPRVIEQTTREKLPPDFGRAEPNLVHGQIDMVVDRRELKQKLALSLTLLGGGVTHRAESPERDSEALSGGGAAAAQTHTGAQEPAVSPGSGLRGRDREDPRTA